MKFMVLLNRILLVIVGILIILNMTSISKSDYFNLLVAFVFVHLGIRKNK